MKKIKNLLIKMELSGNGVVNMDSSEQKWVINSFNISNLKGHQKNDNVLYAKKSFYKDENGEISYRLKISRDCIMHDVFKNDIISQNPNIVHHDAVLYSYIASPVSILRGYLFANSKETLKRKGAITLCDAEQISDGVSTIEVCSRSGERTDNSFFFKETIGNVKYQTSGNIDLKELQFISCDQIFDRYSFNSDKFPIFKEFLVKKLPNFNSELGYYQLKGSSIDIQEHGILLNNDNILFIVKETLKKLLDVNIVRRNAYVKTTSLKIKLIENSTIDTLDSESGWINISNIDDINNLNFDTEMFYEIVDEETANQKRMNIIQKVEETKNAKKDEKAENANKTSSKGKSKSVNSESDDE